ncbi:MAG: LLM class flavin-dependent oxidoreductase [Promethearchaeota archaeon]|nr:MAG: LLM class flavin-dependent oxidoreductase [Candidatus Lokiarchaeota archaeon]
MDLSDVKIGIDASFEGVPFKAGLSMVQNYEKTGFDCVIIDDHLMGLFPEVLWDPEFIDAAKSVESPNNLYDMYTIISNVVMNTKKIQIASGVTECFRRHPADLAQFFLAQNNLSKGRMILGIGAGEYMNTVPYGIQYNKPVTRLREGIKIIKLLWQEKKNVNFNGEVWKLKGACLGLKPYRKNKYPPIWVAAHGPEMLNLTGELADGWYPLKSYVSSPNIYKEKLNIIQESAKKAGREFDKFIPSLFAPVIIDESKEEVKRILKFEGLKISGLFLASQNFENYGISHPLGKNFKGVMQFIPSLYDRKQMMDILEKIPQDIYYELGFAGTSDEIIGVIEDYARVGLKSIILYDNTVMVDMNKVNDVQKSLTKILDYFKAQR